MEPTTKQTETRNTRPESHAAKRIVGVFFSIVEVILALRFVFKILGANSENGFIKIIYDITQFFIVIFEGIFAKITISIGQSEGIFEPATLIAMLIIALVAWAVMKLMTPRKSSQVERTEITDHTKPDNQEK